MADEEKVEEIKSVEQVEEPHGEADEQVDKKEIDWKAEARKWEKRAKANSKQSADDELNQRLAAAEERAANAEKMAAGLKQQNDATNIALEYGIPVNLIHGTNEAEMRESADAVKEYVSGLPAYPIINDKGDNSTPTITKDQIRAIKNPAERKAAIAANIDLFN